jgi:hypothetical protein
MWKIIVALIICCPIESCITIESQHLTYYKQLKTDPTQKLRLDGYYYHNEKLYDWDEERYVTGFILYKDGTYRGNLTSLTKKEDFTHQLYAYSEILRNNVSEWGAYIIEGDLIKIQEFYIKSSGGFGGIWGVAESHGRILNDTTICLYEETKEKGKYEVYYHFKHLMPKPDSTNWLATDKKLNRKYLRGFKK